MSQAKLQARAASLYGRLSAYPPGNRCILKMDLHCVWAVNCVGARNYNCFLVFLDDTGQLFCVSCHTNDTAVLPARVFQHWDLSLYQVSQLAKVYLKSIYDRENLVIRVPGI